MRYNYEIAKTIKSITNRHFTLELVELTNGYYMIIRETQTGIHPTQEIKALDIALALYDDMLVATEGH